MILLHYEDFIDGMDEEDYELWLSSDATEKQKVIAMRIREQIPESSNPNEPPTPQEKERAYRKFISGFKRFFS